MAKDQFTDDDDAILSELGVIVEDKKVKKYTPKEERVIAGFEEITNFFDREKRLPQDDSSKDIFERLYAVRLEQITKSEEYLALLEDFDPSGILMKAHQEHQEDFADLDDEALLEALGVNDQQENTLTHFKHLKPRTELKPAETVAKYEFCEDFDRFKPLFEKVKQELATDIRSSREYKDDGKIEKGEFYMISNMLLYIAEVGEPFMAANGKRPDVRLRVIYSNATEINILRRSLQRALNKDSQGRRGFRITEPKAGPLFENEVYDEDTETGTVYVLRSRSDHPQISKNREIIHKIGVTGGDVNKRIANASKDPTYLLAKVDTVQEYTLHNINRRKLEKLLHKIFEKVQFEIDIKDRFGNPVKPREWFLVPLHNIEEAIERIKDGSITDFSYNEKTAKFEKN